jgi:hypothetical protein
MITEDYVSFEIAKLLKKKGFLKGVDLRLTQNLSFYDNIGLHHNLNKWYDSLIQDKIDFVVAPTHQMAMKWLREKYGIFIAINNDDLDFNWQCYDLINRGSTLDPKILSESYAGYKTYEEAVEAALKYSLENLI